MSQSPARPPSDEAAQAGRGVIYIALAKIYFMIAGAVIEFRLPVILANTVFGAYAVVSSAVSPINNVLVTGSIQAVSRFTAQRPEHARAVQLAGLRMHLWVGLPVALLFIASSPLIAFFLHDMSKIGPLMLAGTIIAGYSFYAIFVGTANGRREFHKQAGLDMGFATLRAAGILGLSIAGLGLIGAIGGWVAAVAAILVISAVVVGFPGRAARALTPQPVKPMISFFAGVGLYLVLLNLIMVVDQLLLKRLAAQWFLAHGDEVTAALRTILPDLAFGAGGYELRAAESADGQVGYYRAVQSLARLSYQFIIAAMFVVFPLVSRSTFESDAAATRRYIHTTMRYSLIAAMGIGVVFAANPRELLDIPYHADYAYFGAPALIALALGNVAFSLFAIAGTILNGAGRTRDAIVVAAVTLAIAALANWIVIPRVAPGRELLLAASSSTAAAMLIGAGLSGWMLRRRLGAFLPALTLVRVPVAMAAALAVGRALPSPTPLMVLAEACVVGLTFLAALVALRELTMADLRAVTAVMRRRKPAAGRGGAA